MNGSITDYISILWDARFALQLLTIATACVLILGTGHLAGKKIGRVIVSVLLQVILLTMLFSVLDILLMLVADRGLLCLRGINFSIAIAIGIMIYTLFRRPYRLHERWTFAALMFSTSVIMMEWSSPMVVKLLFQSGRRATILMNVIADLMILLFAIVIRFFSFTKYELSGFHASLTCLEAVLVSATAIVYEAIQAGMSLSSSVPGLIQRYVVFVFTTMYLTNIMTYIFSYLVAKDRQAMLDMNLVSQKQSAELELFRLSESNLKELREVRHDIKNHCLYMRTMLDQQKYEELREYFEQVVGKFNGQLFRLMDYGNRMVSAIINLEKSKAEAVQVQLNANIVVPPTLPFEENDFCSLTMNLIDNAIEECERTQAASTQKNSVNVIMNMQGEELFYLCVMNPTTKNEADLTALGTFTSKGDKQLHGYGINIISQVAEKYDGHFSCHVENGTFIAEVLLNIKQRETGRG